MGSGWHQSTSVPDIEMKFFLCIFAASLLAGALAMTEEQKTKLKKYSKECQALSGVTDEEIQKMRSGEDVEGDKMMDQVLCITKKAGAMNEAGEMQMDVIREKAMKMMAHEVDRMMEKCAVTMKTPRETAMHFVRCLREMRSNFVMLQH